MWTYRVATAIPLWPKWRPITSSNNNNTLLWELAWILLAWILLAIHATATVTGGGPIPLSTAPVTGTPFSLTGAPLPREPSISVWLVEWGEVARYVYSSAALEYNLWGIFLYLTGVFHIFSTFTIPLHLRGQYCTFTPLQLFNNFSWACRSDIFKILFIPFERVKWDTFTFGTFKVLSTILLQYFTLSLK